MSADDEVVYWLALRRAGLGSVNFSLLLKRFGTIRDAWQAADGEIAAAGLEPQFVRAVGRARQAFDPDSERTWIAKLEVTALTWLDERYPAMLREIPQSPPVLFVRGTMGPSFDRAVAVVGTRRVTPYGRQATEAFCGALATAGVAIISGLARGVDSIAHRCAVEAGTPTVAVIAGGIDQVYPRENAGLAEQILKNGCLVSEYPAGIPARPDYFPRRNRILSGLAAATLVVEAGEGSGALHTANWAFEQGRDVFAVPGSIFSRQSAGTNQLIRESTAKLVTTPDHLLEELNLAGAATGRQLRMEPAAPAEETRGPQANRGSQPVAPVSTSPDEGRILHQLQEGPRHVDELARATEMPVAAVSSTLTMMELRGLVRQERPLVYSLS